MMLRFSRQWPVIVIMLINLSPETVVIVILLSLARYFLFFIFMVYSIAVFCMRPNLSEFICFICRLLNLKKADYESPSVQMEVVEEGDYIPIATLSPPECLLH